MLVFVLHSEEHCNFVRMGEYYVSCSSDISRVRESFRMTVHHDVAREDPSSVLEEEDLPYEAMSQLNPSKEPNRFLA